MKTKVVTVDQRLSCADPIEPRFYSKFEAQNGICAFCTTELKEEDTQELKTLIEKEWKVQPSCAQTECLSLNPKANYKQVWTAHAKQDRKRKQAGAPAPPKKPKKPPQKAPKPRAYLAQRTRASNVLDKAHILLNDNVSTEEVF